MLRVLSTVEMMLDRLDAALIAIDRALAIAARCRRISPAPRPFCCIGWATSPAPARPSTVLPRSKPDSPGVKRAQMTLYLDSGRITRRRRPAERCCSCLPRGPDRPPKPWLASPQSPPRTIDGDYVVVADRTLRPPRPLRPLPGFGERLRNQCRVIHALIIRETRTRFGDSKLGYGWALLEPILHITLLSLVFL